MSDYNEEYPFPNLGRERVSNIQANDDEECEKDLQRYSLPRLKVMEEKTRLRLDQVEQKYIRQSRSRNTTSDEMIQLRSHLKNVRARIAEAKKKQIQEPETIGTVVVFEKMFRGRPYSWAALRAHDDICGNGVWYLSQNPNACHGGMKPMNWDELLNFAGDVKLFRSAKWELMN